jgi:hypothetical protein
VKTASNCFATWANKDVYPFLLRETDGIRANAAALAKAASVSGQAGRVETRLAKGQLNLKYLLVNVGNVIHRVDPDFPAWPPGEPVAALVGPPGQIVTAVVDRDLGCVPAAAWQRASDGSTAALGLIPVSVPELLRQLRGTLIPGPAATSPTARRGPSGDTATSTAPARPINAGTHTPTKRHSRNELQLL